MGQKVHPKSIRLGIVKDWDANWFGTSEYKTLVLEDFEIRKFLKGELFRAGVSDITINRKAETTKAIVSVGRPGVIFGRNGKDLGLLAEQLKKIVGKPVYIEINEIKNSELNARLLGEWVAFQLEKRVPFRRAMKMAIQKAMKAGAEGVKIGCAGRLGGVEIARSEWYLEGKVPLHTLRADIDYAFSEALTTYGKIGIKVWVYNGEVLPTKESIALKEKGLSPAEVR